MGRYSNEFKETMVKKLLSPGAPSASALSVTSGVSQATLSRWLREAASVALVSGKQKKSRTRSTAPQVRRPEQWSPAERLRVVQETSNLTGAELGAYLREVGLHEATVDEWRQQVLAALGGKRKRSQEQKRIRKLERELGRKDKALAEATALLVLSKKVRALWVDEDDEPSGKSGP